MEDKVKSVRDFLLEKSIPFNELSASKDANGNVTVFFVWPSVYICTAKKLIEYKNFAFIEPVFGIRKLKVVFKFYAHENE